MLVIWLIFASAVGLVAALEVGLVRAIDSPSTFWHGSLAGPANIDFLETKALPGKDRNLLLALAYQQSGQDDKAERLYRDLPDFAESWNNLGVLLKKSGKEQEARAAFEQALKLDPARFAKCLDSGEQSAAVQRDRLEGVRLGLSGTPSFFVNGHYFSGAFDYKALRQIVERQLADTSHQVAMNSSK